MHLFERPPAGPAGLPGVGVAKMTGEKIKVGVLGATGAVGQRFIQLLEGHPWFEVNAAAASSRSLGKSYGEAVKWILETPVPERVRGMTIAECNPDDLDCRIVFSGLDALVAGEIEGRFAQAGFAVFSNARTYRMEADVPLVVPEVNAGHLDLIESQQRSRGWKGFIVTNPNCSAVFLAMALAPLYRDFGIDMAFVSTLQAISGAGYPGIPSLDILGNVIPFISGEELKIETETPKILGKLEGDRIRNAPIQLSAHCNRVPVADGHTECVSVKLSRTATLEEIRRSLSEFRGLPQDLRLPSAPSRPLVILDREDRPQPRRDVMLEKGMATLIGRIRPCPVLHVRFVLLGHNTIRGAAGASLLNAELMVASSPSRLKRVGLQECLL